MKKEEYLSAVERNSKRIYLIAFSYLKNQYDAEDILQDVFLKLWKTKKEFNDSEHLDKWLTVTCINKCRDFFRLPFVRHTVPSEECEETCSHDNTDNIDIFNSIMSLPQKERIVIHLFYYENMSVEEIAKAVKATPSSVKTRLCRARKHLKSYLGDDWINE